MPTPRVQAAARGMPTAKDLVFDAEEDMRRVHSIALIIDHHMQDGKEIGAEMAEALSWLTADLVTIGERLRDRHDAMFKVIVGDPS